MNSKSLYEKTNSDDILVRSVIAGLLNLLNHKIDYEQVWDDTSSLTSEEDGQTIIQKVEVPWYHTFGTSQERFMQDNYTFFGKECFNEKPMINGTFAPKPVGWLTYTSSQIDSSSITNRFVQGTYMKRVGNRLVSYTSFLYSMPLTINFDCKIEADNFVSALKIEQAIRETFYKNKTFFVQYRGMQIGCTAGFPETAAIEKTTEYSFDNSGKAPILTFSISVETYQPVFDKTMEMERGNYIKGFGLDVYVPYSKSKNEELKQLRIKGLDNSIGYPSGTTMMIEWEYTSKDSEFLPVQIVYVDKDCPCEEVIIEQCTDNQSVYFWDIPEHFSQFEQPMISYPSNANVIKEPVIKIVPNKYGMIDDTSFIVIDRGYIAYDTDDVPFTFEYTDESGKPIIVKGYKFRLMNGRIDASDPVIVSESDLHRYKITPKKKEISIIVRYTKDQKIYDKVDNLLIY